MSIFSQIKNQVGQYADVYIKLFKINFIERTSSLLSYIMFAMIGLFILFGIIMFVGFALAELFIDLGVSNTGAYFIVSGIYLLLLLLLVVCRRPVSRFFAGGIIRAMTENDPEVVDEND